MYTKLCILNVGFLCLYVLSKQDAHHNFGQKFGELIVSQSPQTNLSFIVPFSFINVLQ